MTKTSRELKESLALSFDNIHNNIRAIKEACEELGMTATSEDAIVTLEVDLLKALRKVRLTYNIPYTGMR